MKYKFVDPNGKLHKTDDADGLTDAILGQDDDGEWHLVYSCKNKQLGMDVSVVVALIHDEYANRKAWVKLLPKPPRKNPWKRYLVIFLEYGEYATEYEKHTIVKARSDKEAFKKGCKRIGKETYQMNGSASITEVIE